MSGAARNVAVLAIGLAVLLFVLFYASTVDARAPSVTSVAVTHRLGASEEIALTTTSVEVVFSEPVDHASAEAAFDIQPPVSGTFRWRGNAMGFTPDRGLPLDTPFEVAVEPGVRDAAGNVMEERTDAFEFRTVGRPTVASTVPEDGAIVGADAAIALTFSTLMDTSSVEEALQLTPRAAYDVVWSGEDVRIQPRFPLEIGTEYTLRIDDTATDVAGLALAEPFTLRFSVVDDALDVGWIMPADDLSGVSTMTPIAIGFDEPIDPSSLEGALTLDPAVPGSFAVAEPAGADALRGRLNETIVRFEPAAPLPANTTFTVELSGVRSREGALLVEPRTWTFTTGVPSPSLQNQIVFLSDRAGVTNLWAMNPDGTNQHQLSAEVSPVTEYAVSPGGDRFVIGDGARLIEQQADGAERRILSDPSVLEFDPSYSPDGRLLVFARAAASTGEGQGIWAREAGGEGVELLVPPDFTAEGLETEDPDATDETSTHTPGASASPSETGDGGPEDDPALRPLLRGPRYSPDAQWVAFVDMRGGVGTVLLETGAVAWAPWVASEAPVWSPASDRVLVSGVRPAAEIEPARPLPRRPLRPIQALAASLPDDAIRAVAIEPGTVEARDSGLPEHATDLAFTSGGALVYRDPTIPGSLWTSSDGSVPRRLVDGDGLRVDSFAIAPQGERLVIATRLGLWVVVLDDGEPVRLTRDGASPAWVP